ncbi:hypothetical protein DFH11DRAFT_1587438 [Phellopilus nigrolimitatus]|nr:hypothetical protein DFH11DRAFT_1587438 [Phellopilus nigrolimitatus]
MNLNVVSLQGIPTSIYAHLTRFASHTAKRLRPASRVLTNSRIANQDGLIAPTLRPVIWRFRSARARLPSRSTAPSSVIARARIPRSLPSLRRGASSSVQILLDRKLTSDNVNLVQPRRTRAGGYRRSQQVVMDTENHDLEADKRGGGNRLAEESSGGRSV